MILKKIDFLDYCKNFSDFTSLCCDYFVKKIEKEKNGILLACYDKKIPIGISVIKIDFKCKEALLYYINVKKEYRYMGVGQNLFSESIKYLKNKGVRRIEIDVILENSFGTIMNHIVNKKSIPVDSEFISYKCFTDIIMQKKWTEFLNQKGFRLLNYSKKSGLNFKRFKDVNHNMINSLKSFPFGSHLLSELSSIDYNWSFIVLKEGIGPVAYVASRLINILPQIIEIPYLAVAKKLHNTSVAACLFVNAVNEFLKNPNCRVIFCVDKKNIIMNRIIKKFLSDKVKSEKQQVVYVLT